MKLLRKMVSLVSVLGILASPAVPAWAAEAENALLPIERTANEAIFTPGGARKSIYYRAGPAASHRGGADRKSLSRIHGEHNKCIVYNHVCAEYEYL